MDATFLIDSTITATQRVDFEWDDLTVNKCGGELGTLVLTCANGFQTVGSSALFFSPSDPPDGRLEFLHLDYIEMISYIF